MNEFDLHIIEADEDFYEGKCISLVVPTPEGKIGIMANRSNMIAAIEMGELKYTLPDGEVCYAAISGGFLKVEDNDVLVLADSVERPEEIDENRAREEEEKALEKLQSMAPGDDYTGAKAMMARAANRLRVKQRYKQ